jgi:ABC transport system ATP-binding/permease protein
LFRNPNFLILDEPTNDLDLPTLGVLENFLAEFPGCLLIVSHDRYFMDRLVDHLFVFEGNGNVRDFPGNYTQFRLWQKAQEEAAADTEPAAYKAAEAPPAAQTGAAQANAKRKLSFKEKREFDQLQNEIAALEKEKAEITEKLNGGNVPFESLQQLSERIGVIAALLDEKELRWLELSEFV